mmetsp:Transcript_39367/g.80746  ORF Transcript_39367/g.80746 Transcript_39367/m.80746 type:complete len:376 (-) Transcript_39367:631-1758(-)
MRTCRLGRTSRLIRIGRGWRSTVRWSSSSLRRITRMMMRRWNMSVTIRRREEGGVGLMCVPLGSVEKLIVLPCAPMAELLLPAAGPYGGTSAGRWSCCCHTCCTRCTCRSSSSSGGRHERGTNVQTKLANIANVGGSTRLGGVERLSPKRHGRCIPIGSALCCLHAASSSSWSSIPTLRMLRRVVRWISVGRQWVLLPVRTTLRRPWMSTISSGTSARPPALGRRSRSASARRCHAPPRRERRGTVDPLRRCAGIQRRPGMLRGAVGAPVPGSQFGTSSRSSSGSPCRRRLVRLGWNSNPRSSSTASDDIQIGSNVRSILPQRLSDLLPCLLVADIPPHPILLFLQKSSGGVHVTYPPNYVVGNVSLFEFLGFRT